MSPDRPRAHALLSSSRVFARIPEAARDRLAAEAVFMSFRRLTKLVRRGEPALQLYCVAEGTAQAVRFHSRENSAYIPLVPGQWINWASVLCDIHAPETLRAMAGTTIMLVPAESVRTAIAADNKALLLVIEEMEAWCCTLSDWIASLHGAAADQRLAHLLLWAAGQLGRSRMGGTCVPMTQAQLGDFGFGPRQRVARLLKSLQDQGLIEMAYGQISLADVGGLRSLLGEERLQR